jgi:predicted DsbA family dithiol-disulfide isomerase
MSDRRIIEVFYDYVCPWCYLGTANTDRLKREREVEIRWTLYPLHPEVPVEGMELADLFGGSTDRLEPGRQRLKDTAAATGLPLARRTRISNSRRAQELEKWAIAMGKGDEYRRQTFHAYFAEGKDIAQLPVLEEIAAAVGMPDYEVWDVLVLGQYAAAVDDDWQRARQMGVTAVPFYLIGDEPLVGYRPYEELLRLVDAG